MWICWSFHVWLASEFIRLSLHSDGWNCSWILRLLSSLWLLLLNQVLRYLLGRLIVIIIIYPVIEIPDIKSQVIIIYKLDVVDLFVYVLTIYVKSSTLHLCSHFWSVIRAHGVGIVVKGTVCIIGVATLWLSSIVDNLEIIHTSLIVDIVLLIYKKVSIHLVL